MPKSRAHGQRHHPLKAKNRAPAAVLSNHSSPSTYGRGTNYSKTIINSIYENAPEEPYMLYDYLEEKCDELEINFTKLIASLRKSAEDNGRWDRVEPNTDKDSGSFHMWLEDANGKIIDPHFREYDGLCKMSNTDGRKKVYHKWTEAQQKEKLKNLIPDILAVIKANCKQNEIPMREMMAILAYRPSFRCCPMNAWSLKSVMPELKVCIGNMGFRSKEDPNKIWWEY
jgi:hypothetical protein